MVFSRKIERLEYELAYYDSDVHSFNHYTTKTPPQYIRKMSQIIIQYSANFKHLSAFFKIKPSSGQWYNFLIIFNFRNEAKRKKKKSLKFQ